MSGFIVEVPSGNTGGVDSHLDAHVAAALDPLGRLVCTESFTADASDYKALVAWLETFGQVTMVGSRELDPTRLAWLVSSAAKASKWSKSTGQTAKLGGTKGSPIGWFPGAVVTANAHRCPHR
jgi:hypothetical protein